MSNPTVTVEYRDGSDEAVFAELMQAVGCLDEHRPTSSAWLLRDFVVRVPICMKPADRHLEAVVTGYGTYQTRRRPLLDLLLKFYGPVRTHVAHADGTPNLEASGNRVLGYTPSAGIPTAHELIEADAKIRIALSLKGLREDEINLLMMGE